MEREKGKSSQKRGPSKVKALFPSGDFIALGSKQRSASDVPDPKPPSKSSSLSTAGPSSERKRNESSTGPPPVQSKKQKLSSAPASSSSSLPRLASASSQLKRDSAKVGDQWDSIAIEVDPTDFLSKVLKAEGIADDERVESLMCGAVKTLKSTRPKPDPMLYLTLMFLAKARPRIFDSEVVIEAFTSLLKRDVTMNFKTKGNNLISVLSSNLLLAAFQESTNWPEQFVKVFVEDSVGDRIWVDHEECKSFVDNVITAFNTRLPPKSMMAPELVFKPDACPSPPAASNVDDDDSLSSLHLDLKEGTENIAVIQRYASSQASVEQYILEVIHEQLNRRQPMDISKNLLRLLICACGISEVRSLVAHRLETWLQNPKLTRPAQDLLLTVCMNCNQHNKHDVEVIGFLIRIRLKMKPVVNHFLQCMKELLGQHPDNLSTVLKHCIYNELSNSRNPNNMQLLSVIFQHSPDKAAQVLAEVFQDLLINRDDYLRCLRALFREIIRSLRHDLNFTVFCQGLMQERKEAQFQELEPPLKERLFMSLTDLIVLSIFLAITPAVREAATALFRGEKKDVSAFRNYQLTVATIQRDTVWWLHTVVPKMFKPGRSEFLHCLHKAAFLEQPEHYCKDNWPPEGDRPFMLRLASDVPVLEDTFIRVLIIGMSKDHPLIPSDALELVEQLVRRAASIFKEDSHPVLAVERTELIDIVFHLCAYHHPENITLPLGYTPPKLAIADYYWKAWITLLIIVAHNPSSFGQIAWEGHPTLRSMMEMCITNHFVFPPPTMTVGEKGDDIKTRELQISQVEKQKILEFETHLAAASKVTITESNSLLLSKLITMDPQGPARRPPSQVLEQLKSLNETLKLGHLLCRSRNPDFLVDIIQRHGTSQSMPWLAELVESCESSFDHLPVQCLCEFLLSDALDCNINSMDQEEEKAEKSKGKSLQNKKRKQQQLLQHLQRLLRNPDDLQATCEVLDYLMRRLSSQQQNARAVATKGLTLVLSQRGSSAESGQLEPLSNYEWLLRDIPLLPHFKVVRAQVSLTLRHACQVENDPSAITAYVKFLASYTPDEDLAELSLDLAQLIVERPTIINCILPQDTTTSVYSQLFLSSLLDVFTRYLQNARKPSKDMYWYECQDHIMVQWPSGETATMHILVVHSMIILLTYGPPENEPEPFNALLETWFPQEGDPPQAFLVDTSEEALLLPDWLKLKMIRSSVEVLVDAALRDLDPNQLVLFIQSFGIPVQSMSKLLACLDEAVEYDEEAVVQAVVDKAYMSQLVEVQHQRGAVGGERFYRLLGESEYGDPLMDTDDVEPVPTSVIQHAPPRHTDTSRLDSVSVAVVQLYSLDPKLGKLGNKQEQELFRGLQKAFSQDVLRKCLFGSSLAEFIHTCEHILESEQSERFVSALHAKPSISCSLFRLAIAAQQKAASNSPLVFKFQWVCAKILELTRTRSPLTSILKHFCTLSSSSRNKDQVPRRLTSADVKSANIVDALTSVAQNESKRFEEALCVLVQRAIKLGNSQPLIHALSKILCENMFESQKVTTSFVIVDWLEHLEPECISSSPELQYQLLFQNSTKNPLLRTTFRPYLLALLIHRAHWNTLHNVIDEVLSPSKKNYDPSAVLDFLQACMFIPKIWQGRDKKIPKHYTPETVLLFNPDQVCSMTDYIIDESLAAKIQQGDGRSKMSSRLPLLEQGCTNQILISSVVCHLMSVIQNEPARRGAAKDLLVELYLCIPSIVSTSDAVAEILKDIEPQTSGQTKVDVLSHTLLLALSIADLNRQAYQKLGDLNIACRKLVATHPELFLRQLPMVASLLHSRSAVGTFLFGTRNHSSFFASMLGMLELLVPQLFAEVRIPVVNDIFDVYVEAFEGHVQLIRNQDTREVIIGLLNSFLLLIHRYLQHNPTEARLWIQRQYSSLQDIASVFPDLMSLRTLLAGTCIVHCPSEGSEQPADSSTESNTSKPPFSSVPSLVPTSNKSPAGKDLRLSMENENSNPEEILSALKDLEMVSSRKPEVLDAYQDDLQCIVLNSSNMTCCSLAFKLLLQSIRNSPRTAMQFISGYLQCLASDRRDLVQMALERLPEFVVLAQEHGSMLLQKAFQVGISTNVNSAVPITESLLLLNLQYGN